MTQLWVIRTFKDREDGDAPAREKNQESGDQKLLRRWEGISG